MPRRTDIHSILIIGSGPIVIGQGCEFDYSGVQACRALREEGYRIVLVNSNPATIMTDPEFADATYIEPITPEAVEKILAAEKASGTPVDALLPTLGGQTGLNVGMACYDRGILERYGVQMIGANREAIFRGEDRQRFKDLMIEIGLKVPKSGTAHTLEEARQVLDLVGLPAIIRPAFTLGGTGGGIAYNVEEFETIVVRGLDASPVSEVLIEQSVIGWKEYELEVVRDRNDNCIVVCSIENIDAMGVHTGDSITVAPIQTLTDKEYQRMRDAAFAIIRAVGVETGGSNIQFAVNPENGEMVVVEMNPRVSRSSALASKATGYPIAKIAAKLAVGYTLDELPNPITSRKRRTGSDASGYPNLVETSGCPSLAGAASDPSLAGASSDPSLAGVASGPDGAGATNVTVTDDYELHTSACFEPTIDYVVVKLPRWTFEKFPDADETLTTQMKSVGEAMAIGRTFKEALQKGIRSMEVKRFGFGLDGNDKWLASLRGGNDFPIPEEKLRRKLSVPSQGRLYYVRYAFKSGWSVEQVHTLTRIDPWFLAQMKELVDFESTLVAALGSQDRTALVPLLRRAKQLGYSDVQLDTLCGLKRGEMRAIREKHGITPVYKLVDTCAAEFEAATPYYYSTYETPFVSGATGNQQPTASSEDEIRLSDKPKIIILGGGPNRIGQGIEFDYCCVQAAFAMRELGFESVMVNSNPETVSTDYDTSDLLFFEPLTHEDVLNICERLNGGPFKAAGSMSPIADPRPAISGADAPGSRVTPGKLVHGVIVQFGGQTPLNLARGLHEAGVPLLGTSIDSLDRAGDREQFRDLLRKLGLKQPANGIARNLEDAKRIAAEVGYPVLVRPSFVLGGRAMEIVSDEAQLGFYMQQALGASTLTDTPILIDKFLDNATECDVDCIADYDDVGNGSAIVIGVMEHIEEAGIHSGDSACVLPPHNLPREVVEELKRQTRLLARELRVRGLMNVQYAVKQGEIYVIEVNPRASRTVPFVGKATGIPWAKVAAKVMAGKKLSELGYPQDQPDPKHVSVKEVVFPFSKLPGVDIILGPEMRSTGEVMGIDRSFELAFAKSQIAAGTMLPTSGTVYVSVRDDDKPEAVRVARLLSEQGFEIIATGGTFAALQRAGVPARRVNKIAEGRPNIVDEIKNGRIQLMINTPTRKGPKTDEGRIRAMSVTHRVPIFTTMTGAHAAARAIAGLRRTDWTVRPLQQYHGK